MGKRDRGKITTLLKLLGVVLTLLQTISCIDERVKECPNWGLYQVLLTTPCSKEREGAEELLLLYTPSSSSTINYYRANSEADDPLCKGEEPLLLPPGSHLFCSLLSSEREQFSETIELKNRVKYLYCSTIIEVKKRELNVVELNHQLANSLLEIELSIKRESSGPPAPDKDKITIEGVEVTLPTKGATIELLSGRVTQSEEVAPYLEPLNYCNNSGRWYNYCNPSQPGVEITLRILFREGIEGVEELYSKFYLPEGFPNGRITLLRVELTPYQLKEIEIEVEEWREERENDSITL